MTNLTVQTNQETNFTAYVDTQNQKAFLTASAIHKILGVHAATLHKIVEEKGVHNYADEYSQVLTDGGLQGVHKLYAATDLKVILKAYNPRNELQKQAKERLIDGLLDAGATAYVFNQCGYKMQLSTTQTTTIDSPTKASAIAKVKAQLVGYQESKAIIDANPEIAEMMLPSLIAALKEEQPIMATVVKRAIQLGLTIDRDENEHISLGLEVARATEDSDFIQVRKTGQNGVIYLERRYYVTPELDDAIESSEFARKQRSNNQY